MKIQLTHSHPVIAGKPLHFKDLAPDPLKQFLNWFEQAYTKDPINANSVNVATVDTENQPRIRTVLLKKADERGFVFFTNYNSKKGKALSQCPKICLHFYWPTLARQVIIEGVASTLNHHLNADYFHSRPRASQISAYISRQSEQIENSQQLNQRVQATEKQFANLKIPLPSDWGGYLVKPHQYEFWQGRESRLHDRFCYQQTEKKWQIKRLSP